MGLSLATDPADSPFLIQPRELVLQRCCGPGEGLVGCGFPHTHLSRPRMKALKRMV